VDSLNIDSSSPVAIEFDIPSRMKSTLFGFNTASEADFLRSCVGLEVELTLLPSAHEQGNRLTGLINFVTDILVALSEYSNNARSEIESVSILHKSRGLVKVQWKLVVSFKLVEESMQAQ